MGFINGSSTSITANMSRVFLLVFLKANISDSSHFLPKKNHYFMQPIKYKESHPLVLFVVCKE